MIIQKFTPTGKLGKGQRFEIERGTYSYRLEGDRLTEISFIADRQPDDDETHYARITLSRGEIEALYGAINKDEQAARSRGK